MRPGPFALPAVCMLAGVATAEPQPEASVGVTQSLAVERNFSIMTSLDLGIRIADKLWLDGAIGIGAASLFDPGGSGQDDSRVLEARAGLGRMSCGKVGCLGAFASLGYHRQRTDYTDGLLDPPMYTEKRDLAFGELRGVARARILWGHAALEAALGLRANAILAHEHAEGGGSVGAVGSLGIHATF